MTDDLAAATNRLAAAQEAHTAFLRDMHRGNVKAGFPTPVSGEDWNIQVSLVNVGNGAATVRALALGMFTTLPDDPVSCGDRLEIRETDTILSPGQHWEGMLPFTYSAMIEGTIAAGYIDFEDGYGKTIQSWFAVSVHSTEEPGRHYYHRAGPDAYHEDVVLGA